MRIEFMFQWRSGSVLDTATVILLYKLYLTTWFKSYLYQTMDQYFLNIRLLIPLIIVLHFYYSNNALKIKPFRYILNDITHKYILPFISHLTLRIIMLMILSRRIYNFKSCLPRKKLILGQGIPIYSFYRSFSMEKFVLRFPLRSLKFFEIFQRNKV